MREKIAALLTLLQKYAEAIMCDNQTGLTELREPVSNALSDAFPVIITAYGDAAMVDLADQVTYWVDQLRRITSALASADSLQQLDVLYFETWGNLIEFMNMIDERGVKDE